MIAKLLFLPAVGRFKLQLMNGGTCVEFGIVFVIHLLWIEIRISNMYTLWGLNKALFIHSRSIWTRQHVARVCNRLIVFSSAGFINQELPRFCLKTELSPSARGGGWLNSPNRLLDAKISVSLRMVCLS